MEFTFDLSQTPVIGRRFLSKEDAEKAKTVVTPRRSCSISPADVSSQSGWKRPWMCQVNLRQALSEGIFPHHQKTQNTVCLPQQNIIYFQGRVRECLVNLLTTCGQRVGLPKSPSVNLVLLCYLPASNSNFSVFMQVIFSQTSDLIERQSSMASSTEEVSAGNNDMSGGSRRDDAAAEFGVFKDFDFLEYESESIEVSAVWGKFVQG